MNYTNNVKEILSFYDSSDLLVFFYFHQSIALIFANKLYTLSKCYLAKFDCLRTLSNKLSIFDQILFSVSTKSNTFSNFYIEGRERDETKTNLKFSRIFLIYSNFHLLKINLDKMGSQYDPSMLNEYLPQYYRRLFPYKSYIQWIRSVKKCVV